MAVSFSPFTSHFNCYYSPLFLPRCCVNRNQFFFCPVTSPPSSPFNFFFWAKAVWQPLFRGPVPDFSHSEYTLDTIELCVWRSAFFLKCECVPVWLYNFFFKNVNILSIQVGPLRLWVFAAHRSTEVCTDLFIRGMRNLIQKWKFNHTETNKQNKQFLVYVNAFIAMKSVLLESVELNCVCCFFLI